MPPRRRPTAFEVSFPELAEEAQDDGVDTDTSIRKRTFSDANDANGARDNKRPNTDADRPRSVRYYVPKPTEILETDDFVVIGEDPEDSADGSKPVRLLRDFSFFDAAAPMEMRSLELLGDGTDAAAPACNMQGAGVVFPTFEDDEDEGQEDDDEDEEFQDIRLPDLLRYSFDYLKEDDPVYVETENAFYILQGPSRRYRRYFREFYKPLRILQAVLSTAFQTPEQEYHDFLKHFSKLTVLDQPLSEGDLWSVVPKLNPIIECLPYSGKLRNAKFVRHLLKREPPLIPRQRLRPPTAHHGENKSKSHPNQTRVTPRIAKLAAGLFKEELGVVGPPPKKEAPPPYAALLDRVRVFVDSARRVDRKIEYRREQRIRPRSRWLKSINIDRRDYLLGDVILVANGRNDGQLAPELPAPQDVPTGAKLADYFWFGKIIYINEEYETIHCEWFEHASKTVLQEISDPQELFLTNICSTIDFKHVVGKVQVHYFNPSTKQMPQIPPFDFFYKFMYDTIEATFTQITPERMKLGKDGHPPTNCPVCIQLEEQEEQQQVQRIPNGVAWHGVNYHVDDSVLIKSGDGPCHIGHIVDILAAHHDGDEISVQVKLYGRIDRLGIRPASVLKDERHLFVTDDQMTVPLTDLIGICYVYVHASIPAADYDTWLSSSPRHFFVKYGFPSLHVRRWDERRKLATKDLLICKECVTKNTQEVELTKAFLRDVPPLRAFDPFGGVGAFGLALEQSGCVKVTHTVEICPDAAKTLKNNASRGTKVYNQCANVMLRHAIKTHAGHDVEDLRSINGERLPAPPKPEDIDCILAGFPCQSHSTLNMYRKANDLKSNLILNVLSWVDYADPKICIFENVRGFLSFRLKARQATEHRIEGGIELGGLKFVLRAMIDMNYQVRFALLQAAHYGTPQTRVRFFMIAAKPGTPLPEFPQPSHSFPEADSLRIPSTRGKYIRPIRTTPGTAPHQFVSIDDAISDLLRFDWKEPQDPCDAAEQREEQTSRQPIRAKICDAGRPFCGFHGPEVEYEHPPRNSFQRQCRRKESPDLQHYTRTYHSKKVERVLNIPMEANADYRRLRAGLWEYHFANPTSAVAKASFRPGLYGRVDKDRWFQTTVTNVDPSAKQCRVLNPYCKRIFTVRELARSQGFPDHFVFYSEDDKVKRMHRQIGNAVPWPLSIALGRELRSALMKQWSKDQESRALEPVGMEVE